MQRAVQCVRYIRWYAPSTHKGHTLARRRLAAPRKRGADVSDSSVTFKRTTSIVGRGHDIGSLLKRMSGAASAGQMESRFKHGPHLWVGGGAAVGQALRLRQPFGV